MVLLLHPSLCLAGAPFRAVARPRAGLMCAVVDIRPTRRAPGRLATPSLRHDGSNADSELDALPRHGSPVLSLSSSSSPASRRAACEAAPECLAFVPMVELIRASVGQRSTSSLFWCQAVHCTRTRGRRRAFTGGGHRRQVGAAGVCSACFIRLEHEIVHRRRTGLPTPLRQLFSRTQWVSPSLATSTASRRQVARS